MRVNRPKLLITGFSGFVASHFVDYVFDNNLNFQVYGVSSKEPHEQTQRINSFFKIDLRDKDTLHDAMDQIKPDYVLHLAATSSVAYSWLHPEDSFMNNCNIFLNLLNAIRELVPSCRILSVGSSEEYGYTNIFPITENQPLNPISPYAVARVAQEQLSKVFVNAYGMKIIMTRSFNHIGPRQDDRFVIPSFIKRILNIKYSGSLEGEIETGDLSLIRDFIDVRDVCCAYYKLLMDGRIGEIYNVCSGNAVTLSDVVDIIADNIGIKVDTKVNPKFVRPCDNKKIIGSPTKIERELGWKAIIPLKKTIKDMIDFVEKSRS